jgi:hypothetical protein
MECFHIFLGREGWFCVDSDPDFDSRSESPDPGEFKTLVYTGTVYNSIGSPGFGSVFTDPAPHSDPSNSLLSKSNKNEKNLFFNCFVR